MANHSGKPRPASVQIGNVQVQGFTNLTTEVENYLGIQYATIPARFRPSQVTDLSSLNGVLDATQYGPRCPQNPMVRTETAHLYQGVRLGSEDSLDEFGCLRLNIYTPPQPHQPFPVLVWIHGGGFIFGDGNSEYDGNFLVRHSIDNGKPIVFVAMNYRLGYFGFLTSKELKAEAVSSGETPFTNVGLYDQRVALLWIQKYIHHFGGDPSNVTIAGESAGGWSVLAHLRSNVPICQRGIIMSSPNLDFPRVDEAQATFDELVASTDVAPSASDAEKLAALRSLSSEDIVRLMGRQLATPLWDEEWFVYQDGARPIAGPAPFAPWVKGVIAGSTKDEAAVFGGTGWRSWEISQFEERVKSAFLDPGLALELTNAYGLGPTSSKDTYLRGFVDMATDSLFSGLPFIIAGKGDNSPSPPVSLYRFDQLDTFDESPLKGYAYHALDNPFFCRLPAVAGPTADQNMRTTSDQISRAVMEFAHGSQPWETYDTSQRVMIFNGKDTGLVKRDKVDRWRSITEAGDPARLRGVNRSGTKLLGIRHSSMSH